MGSFGERMQREREMRGITLEEISESTKISTRSLEALEHEEFDKLPGGIFNKGFIRAYARYLGIDEEQAVADFIAVAGDSEQPLPNPPPRPRSTDSLAPEKVNWSGVVVLVLLFALGIATVWKLAPRAYRGAKSGLAAVRLHLHARRTPAPPPITFGTPPPPPPPAAPAVGAAAKLEPAPAAGKRHKAEVAKVAKLPDKPPTSGENGFVVLIRAKEDSWVSITADGKPFSEGMLNADSVEQVRASREIVLKTGHARGMEVSHNGKPVALGDGEVTTVIFTPQGVQR
jgi:cytoskeleton protein RodZ